MRFFRRVRRASASSGRPQLEEFLRLLLELRLELFLLLLGEQGCFLGLRFFERGELLGLRFFARDALALFLLFLGGLQARFFLRRPLARLLQGERLAHPFLVLRDLELRPFLVLRRLVPGCLERPAGLFLVPCRLGPGCFLQFHPANPFLFLRRALARHLQRRACLEALFLQAQLLRRSGLLGLEPG